MKALLPVLTIAALVAAGAQQAPPRDLSPTIGSASISGVVVSDEADAAPVRRAIVSLRGGDLRPSRGAITDDDGRFTIGQLPAGRFTLTVTRPSYVTSVYGAKRAGRPGTAIEVAEGARITDLVVRLWRGAAIAGVVRDEQGMPVEGIPVTAIRARSSGSTTLTLSNNGMRTDNRGEYRIFGLEPGTYVVAARPSSGGGGPMTAMSEAEIDAALAAIQRRGATPSAGASSLLPRDAPPPAPFEYAPVYHPGTAALAQASPLTLTPGQEALGIDITLQRIPTATIDGIVTLPDGTPAAGAGLQLKAIVAPGLFSTDAATINATAGPDGTFRIAQVTPGDYRLIARSGRGAGPPPASPARGGVVTPPTGLASLWAVADLTMAGSDVRGLSMALGAGVTVSGRIAFAGESLTPPADLTQVRVWLQLPELARMRPGTSVNAIGMLPPVPARADGTFQIASILPDTYRLVVQGPGIGPEGWWVRSATSEGRDLLDGLVTLPPGADLNGVVITLSDRHTELSGRLETPAGAAASDVFVIAYPAERALWLPGSRRIQAVRPDVNGRFRMSDLPPGEYLLGAVEDAEPDEWEDPAYLAKLAAASIKITIAEGEKKVQDLRIGGR